MKRVPLLALSVLSLPLGALAAGVADLVDVESPTARAVPAGVPNSAGYLTLHNRDSSDHRVVAAHSGVATSVELHTHSHVNGMMQMRRVDAVELPAGETVVFQPGGLHVMFIGLGGAIERGAGIVVELEYEDGSRDTATLIAE